MVYIVPLHNSTIPIASETSYLAYKHVQYNTIKSDFQRKFVPYVQVGTGVNQQWVLAPRVASDQAGELNFGHSLLFVKSSTTASSYTFKIIVTCTV